MAYVRRLNFFYLKNRQELVLAEFEESVAFAAVEFLEIENILIKRDRLFNVVDFDCNVITSVDLHTHFFNRSKALIKPVLRVRISFRCTAASSSISFSPLAVSSRWRCRRSPSPALRVINFPSTKRST